MTRPELPLDFASGKLPLAYWLRSAAFMASAQGDDLGVPVSAACDWVTRFDAWYKEVLGLSEGRRLHLLYHREMALVGNDLLSAAPRLKEFGRTAHSLGFGVSITVDLGEAMALEDTFIDLISDQAYNHVAFRVLDSDTALSAGATAFVERIIGRSDVRVGLIAPLHLLRDMGLLASPIFNQSDMTVFPIGSLLEGSLPQPPNPVAPCFSRIRLHVDDAGFIYPCLGLLGVPGAELGSVHDPMDRTVLGGRPYFLDLARLVVEGPQLEHPAPEHRVSGLPWICEQHRMALLDGP